MEKSEEYREVMAYMKEEPWKSSPFGYIVSEEWWNSWYKWVTDNTGQVQRPDKLRNDTYLHSYDIKINHYRVLHPDAWKVFTRGTKYSYKPELLVFFYNEKPDFTPLNLYVTYKDTLENTCITISAKATVNSLISYLKYKYSVDCSNEVIKIESIVVTDKDKTLENLGAIRNTKVFIGNVVVGRPAMINTSTASHTRFKDSRRNAVKNFSEASDFRKDFTEVLGFRNEDFIEPDPAPVFINVDPPEHVAKEMIAEALRGPYLTFPILSKAEVELNIKLMLEDFLKP